ncbi:class I SAM-dependent methyltransferase [Aquicella lusitana]|uniref:Methyltransferase family protein n=1 Tax=Aquicella lusitana TaxID=254246 RepID=A0A370GY35_9COXI|nr:class I SAM-dependent methyltransferase [Aquicella lusitana]RDI48170.1 methyltransferase family protein [Aquicella lusitana]VVC72814.1 Trans-aconitate 2-methyltransferase [Aquicella lusitana]
MTFNSIKSDVAKYYAHKLKTFGTTNLGVDWSSEASQLLRFQQLSKAITQKNNFSILDLGCGYGAYFEYLSKNYKDFSYIGVDISHEMIEAAKTKHSLTRNALFICASGIPDKVDFSIASGIFNVMLDHSKIAWEEYYYNTLNALNSNTIQAFSFNCLTIYSDKEHMKDNLYYADPLETFDYCKKKFSKNVALLHDYNLYEFTIIVRKKS